MKAWGWWSMSDVFALSALDYIRFTLAQLNDLKAVKLFIRGAWPLGNVPQQLCPYCELYISNRDENPEDYATSVDGILYRGGIRFIDNLADNTGIHNWVDVGAGRVIELPGYSQLATIAVAAHNELLRCAHNDLGGLNVADEWCCAFNIGSNALGFGLEQNQTRNTWYNVAEIKFTIRAQHTRQE